MDIVGVHVANTGKTTDPCFMRPEPPDKHVKTSLGICFDRSMRMVRGVFSRHGEEGTLEFPLLMAREGPWSSLEEGIIEFPLHMARELPSSFLF